MKNTAQYSSWDAALYQPATGTTFCFPIRRLVTKKEVKVLPPKIASNFRVRSSASDHAEGERSGNKNVFRASPTRSGSLVWKVSAITMIMTVWGICDSQKRRLSAVRRKDAYIATLSWSFLSGATVLQKSWSCDAMLALYIQRRLLKSAPHRSISVTACLVGYGGWAGA